MIQSMTGFGRTVLQLNDKQLIVEARSLNSKNCEIHLKCPSIYREKEMAIRSLITKKLKRGKIELSIQVTHLGSENRYTINKDQFQSYFADLQSISERNILLSKSDFIQTICKLPDVIVCQHPTAQEEELEQLLNITDQTLSSLIEFRISEGAAMTKAMAHAVATILTKLDTIISLSDERISQVKKRLSTAFLEWKNEHQIDQNRFEQELIFYLEKLDINEEIVRLKKHCSYFNEVMNEQESQGKKLGFIAQEMGREINTIGSKSNFATMQRVVVEMKDELEKIKEQVLNIL